LAIHKQRAGLNSSLPYLKKWFVTVLILVNAFGQTGLYAQHDTIRSRKYLAIPVVFQTPEMGWSFGVSASVSYKTTYRTDPETRTSIVQVIGFVTSRGQNVQALDAIIFMPKEKYVFLGSATHSYFPDKFWGLGPHTHDSMEEKYQFEQIYFTSHLKRRIFNRVYGGLLYEMQRVYNIQYQTGGVFDTSDFVGKSSYYVSGPGLSLSYDKRNAAFWPEKGCYIYTQLTGFRHEFGSTFNMFKWITDIRYFQKLFPGNILAFQLYHYETLGEATPLRELASIGGPNNMRGFYQGRYRGRKMVSFITEYRWSVIGRFGLCFFGGVGDAYTEINEVKPRQLKFSYGAGIRFALLEKEKLNIRLDYGFASKYNNGFYVTVGECF
jgi:outer membrane protein assembly factor BamA